MKIANTKSELLDQVEALKLQNPRAIVGFIPTMGALHNGHLALITKASESCDIIITSVFVNPTQFNSQEDLIKYPRTIKEDTELLIKTSCDILYHPDEKEVYPDNRKSPKVELDGLDTVMEGAFRPDHFEGVVTVVNRLFELVNPDRAFFGKKDFQQLAIIQQMVKKLDWQIEIVPVEIERASNGLALSSRNSRLTEEQKEAALIIIETLKFGSQLSKDEINVPEIKAQMVDFFNKGSLELEYLEIAHAQSLQTSKNLDEPTVCCIAAYCGDVRLIDNMEFSRD